MEDYDILEVLSSGILSELKIPSVVLSFGDYDIEANLQDIYDAGIEIDYATGLCSYPCEARYHDTGFIVLANGKSFPAKMTKSKENKVIGKKIGRNELCPCGSGKKYKKCCGNPLIQ